MPYDLGKYRYDKGKIYKQVLWFIYKCIDKGPYTHREGMNIVDSLHSPKSISFNSFVDELEKINPVNNYTKSIQRIDETLNLIHEVWNKNPELRLCQLLSNVAKKGGWKSDDLFYLEDSKLIYMLRKEI